LAALAVPVCHLASTARQPCAAVAAAAVIMLGQVAMQQVVLAAAEQAVKMLPV
jgi:hypothetical protein